MKRDVQGTCSRPEQVEGQGEAGVRSLGQRGKGRGISLPAAGPASGIRRRAGPLLFLFVAWIAGCAGGAGSGGSLPPEGPSERPASTHRPQVPGEDSAGAGGVSATVGFTVVADSILPDGAMEELVAPYRDRMGEEVRQVIGEAAVLLAKSVPEGTLGNFATDAMLWAARRAASDTVHMALTNNGGLRVPIPPGPITVGQMFELMPFENMLSILTLSGIQVQELADELADRRGQPISGFSFRIETMGDRRVARDLTIDGVPPDPEAEYRLVTNDYMANGGEDLGALRRPLAREDLPILLRDAFIAYVREVGVVRAEIEGRITGGIGR